MRKETSWKKADFDNRIPCWRKHPIKFKKEKSQIERVLASLDYEKLAIIGKRSNK